MAKRKWRRHVSPIKICHRYQRMGRKRKRYLQLYLGALIVVLGLLIGLKTIATNNQADANNDESLSSEEQFIETIGQFAHENYQQSHVLPSVVTAQAILESDFGRSELSANYHNLFGRKAYGNEPSVSLATNEVVNGETITISGRFKVYDDDQAAIIDHGKLMTEGVNWDPQLYHGVVGERRYKKATKALQQAGYATDPNYDDKLNDLIETYDLQRFDP